MFKLNESDKIIVHKLAETGFWSEDAAIKGIRAGFKCEYCGKDLLKSLDNYKQWQEDHIIPKHAGGSDDFDNIAISCWMCNFHLKKKWNPANVCKKNSTREDLLNATKEYIKQKRKERMADLKMFRSIVNKIG